MAFNPFRRCANLWCFLVFFCLCYFLETITFTYLVSAVQSIERQFEIPSRMSGSLVAASDIGYVVTVVVLAYLGSRGNRARWIGGGCLLIAIASFIIALPTFVFPPNPVVHNAAELMKGIFEPLTREQIATPQAFQKTMWGKRLPYDVHECLDASGQQGQHLTTMNFRLGTNSFDSNAPIDQEEGDETIEEYEENPGIEKLEIHSRKQRSVDESFKRLSDFANENKLTRQFFEKIEIAIIEFYYFDEPFETFAQKMYNITNEKSVVDMATENNAPYEPLTLEQIRTPHALANSKIGQLLPLSVKDTLMTIDGAKHRISKRQASNVTASDSASERLRQKIEMASTEFMLGCWLGVDYYKEFSQKMFNITNDKQVPDRILASAGLPFGFCRNVSMVVKARMKVAKCKHQETETGNSAAFVMVFVGIMLVGVGHSMPWTLGMPMIDDNVKKQKTPYYFAGVFFVRIMGPVVGFLLGAICSKLYVTLQRPPPGITPLDPRWIGAWWLGFLVVFATLTIPSIILMLFPKFETKQSIKNSASAAALANKTRTPRDMKNGDTSLVEGESNNYHKENNEVKKTSVTQELRGFGASLQQILRSPIYTGSLIGRLFDAFAFKGYFVFKPKYLENHYGLTQFKSSIYMGVMGVVGFAGGVVVGSLLMRKAKLEGRKAAAYVGACSLIAAALSIGQTFLGCHSVVNQIGQIGMDHGNGSEPTWPTCYGCDCDAAGLYPVCSPDGTPYYSPCHAGCTNFTFEQVGLDVNFDFEQCSCTNHASKQVSRKWCQDDCQQPLILYFVFSTVAGIISGSSVIPGVLIVLRSVPKEHRSVALGFSGFIVSLISTFPSPPVYGLIIDTACIVWTTACGGARGSCQMYDPKALRHRIYFFHGGLRCLALLFDIWVWYYAKDLKLMEDEENEEVREEDRPRMPFTPSFAHEIEDEVKGLQVDGSDVLARKMSM